MNIQLLLIDLKRGQMQKLSKYRINLNMKLFATCLYKVEIMVYNKLALNLSVEFFYALIVMLYGGGEETFPKRSVALFAKRIITRN